MLADIFQPFVEKSPVSVMARAALERLLAPSWVDEVFEKAAGRHYTRTLLFSSVFTLMVRVVFGHAKSVRKSYLPKASEMAVSLTSVYNKLNGIPPTIVAALVRESGRVCTEVIDEMGGRRKPELEGYRLRILDGNWLAATQHRIKELRPLGAGALPGKSLVVYDPALGCALDVVPCEDGHAQERALMGAILLTVQRGDLWIADRNFCTRRFLFGIAQDRNAHFVVREHKNLPVQACGPQRKIGKTETGRVFEQDVEMFSEDGEHVLRLRRVTVRLKNKTRDGDGEIHVLTNLPKRIKATKAANLYRRRAPSPKRYGASATGASRRPSRSSSATSTPRSTPWAIPARRCSGFASRSSPTTSWPWCTPRCGPPTERRRSTRSSRTTSSPTSSN